MSLTNQKIRIASPAISCAIQEDLFKQGYRWPSVGQVPHHTAGKFLYAREDGTLRYGTDEQIFLEKDTAETVYTTATKLVVVSKKESRTKVVLFGKTYFKDELDAALAALSEARS